MEEDLNTYEAPVKCINCGYRGPASLPIGVHVWGGTCPLCHVDQRLRPDNEAWHEDRDSSSLWPFKD